jgi:hypothetical protein
MSGGESENKHQLLDGRKSDADGKQRQPLGTNNNSNFMEQLFANTSSDSRVGNGMHNGITKYKWELHL